MSITLALVAPSPGTPCVARSHSGHLWQPPTPTRSSSSDEIVSGRSGDCGFRVAMFILLQRRQDHPDGLAEPMRRLRRQFDRAPTGGELEVMWGPRVE